MKRIDQKGLTLVELLLATAILGIIAAAATPLVSICFESHKNGTARFQHYHEGLIAMERMTDGVRRSTFLLIPNAHNRQRGTSWRFRGTSMMTMTFILPIRFSLKLTKIRKKR